MPRAKKIPAPPVEPAAVAEPIPQPQPTSPAVLALQEEIVSLVRGRAVIHARVDKAHAGLMSAQAKLQTAQGQFQRLEQEVNYRMGLIAQLEGKAAQNYGFTNGPQQFLTGLTVQQVGTNGPNLVTMPQTPQYEDESDLINRAHASRAAI